MKAKVFISYSRSDSGFVQQLRAELMKADLSSWIDVDRLRPGTEWQPKLEEALRTASAVVVCLSPQSAKSAYVTFEWSYALGAGVKVFPLIVKETTLHPRLSRVQWIDMSGKNPPWLDLVNALKTIPRSRRTERRANRTRNRPTVNIDLRRKSKPGEPLLMAKFELKNGMPIKIGDEYSIELTIDHPPLGTNYVDYELHDDSFDQPCFRVEGADTGFKAWISSYGDVKVSACGKSGKKTWVTKEMLGAALRRGHGKRPTKTIQKAIQMIERY